MKQFFHIQSYEMLGLVSPTIHYMESKLHLSGVMQGSPKSPYLSVIVQNMTKDNLKISPDSQPVKIFKETLGDH